MYVSTGDGRLYMKRGETWDVVTDELPGYWLTTVGERSLYTGDTGLFRSRDAGRTWQRLSCELLVTDIAVSPRVPDALFFGAALPEDDQGDSGGLYRSTDSGKSWSRTSRFPMMDSRQPSVNVLALDPRDPNTLYIGLESGGVQVSRDGGAHWEFVEINPEDPGLFGPQLTSISFGPGTVWTSSRLQGVFRGDTHATNWEPRGLRGRWVYWVVADPKLDSVALAGTEGGLLRTSDGGVRWRRVAGLPQEAVGLLATEQGVWFAWADRSIFRSDDHGLSWAKLPSLPS